MHVALTLPNTVSRQEPSKWSSEQSFDALSSDALNTSFFMPPAPEVTAVSFSLEDLNSLRVDGQSKQIAEQERAIVKLNQDFAELAFSISDFNRVSSAAQLEASVVAPPIRLREDRDKAERAQNQSQEIQLAA